MTEPLVTPKPLMTPHDVARFFGVKRKTIYEWLKNGKLPGHKIGGVWRVYRVDLPAPKGAK